MRPILGLAVGVLAGILVGFLGAFALHQQWNFEISRELDPIALLDLAVTFVIALFLQQYLTRQASVEAAERDLLREQLKAVDAALRGARGRFLPLVHAAIISRSGYQSLLRELRDLANEIYLLESALDMCHPGKGWLTAVKGMFYGYRRAVTGTAVPGRQYPPGTLGKAERQYRELAKELLSVARSIGHGRS